MPTKLDHTVHTKTSRSPRGQWTLDTFFSQHSHNESYIYGVAECIDRFCFMFKKTCYTKVRPNLETVFIVLLHRTVIGISVFATFTFHWVPRSRIPAVALSPHPAPLRSSSHQSKRCGMENLLATMFCMFGHQRTAEKHS